MDTCTDWIWYAAVTVISRCPSGASVSQSVVADCVGIRISRHQLLWEVIGSLWCRMCQFSKRRVDTTLQFSVAHYQHNVVVPRRQTDSVWDAGIQLYMQCQQTLSELSESFRKSSKTLEYTHALLLSTCHIDTNSLELSLKANHYCYSSSGSGSSSSSSRRRRLSHLHSQPKLILDLATPEGCKAELTWWLSLIHIWRCRRRG